MYVVFMRNTGVEPDRAKELPPSGHIRVLAVGSYTFIGGRGPLRSVNMILVDTVDEDVHTVGTPLEFLGILTMTLPLVTPGTRSSAYLR